MNHRSVSTASDAAKTGLSRRAILLSTLGCAAATAFAKVGGVDIGVCGNPPDFLKAPQYGYDYFEPSAATIAAMTDTAYAAFRDQVLASPIRCSSVNILFRNQKVVGPDVNLD